LFHRQTAGTRKHCIRLTSVGNV